MTLGDTASSQHETHGWRVPCHAVPAGSHSHKLKQRSSCLCLRPRYLHASRSCAACTETALPMLAACFHPFAVCKYSLGSSSARQLEFPVAHSRGLLTAAHVCSVGLGMRLSHTCWLNDTNLATGTSSSAECNCQAEV